MLGRRKTREDDGVQDDSRRADSDMAALGEDGGTTLSGNETDVRQDKEEEEEEEGPRDILAICKQGNSLGIAAVRGLTDAPESRLTIWID